MNEFNVKVAKHFTEISSTTRGPSEIIEATKSALYHKIQNKFWSRAHICTLID
uniref:Uncharacterized protein n=1 Tax=Rhizophora mucronata TaxID=61149 RepID=A0A2P2M138_RHIMU